MTMTLQYRSFCTQVQTQGQIQKPQQCRSVKKHWLVFCNVGLVSSVIYETCIYRTQLKMRGPTWHSDTPLSYKHVNSHVLRTTQKNCEIIPWWAVYINVNACVYMWVGVRVWEKTGLVLVRMPLSLSLPLEHASVRVGGLVLGSGLFTLNKTCPIPTVITTHAHTTCLPNLYYLIFTQTYHFGEWSCNPLTYKKGFP